MIHFCEKKWSYFIECFFSWLLWLLYILMGGKLHYKYIYTVFIQMVLIILFTLLWKKWEKKEEEKIHVPCS